MNAAVFDQLQRTLAEKGADAAIDQLCRELRQEKEYNSLFYALLLKKRHELGVSPVPTGPAQDLPEAVHQPYEEAIREAGREVGNLWLAAGNLPQAWAYFRMLGEPEAVRAALEQHVPADGEDMHTLVQIAFYENVHPTKGFDWALSRFGLCSAITTMSSAGELPLSTEVRQYCIGALVRNLYEELRERLALDIERQEGKRPPEADAPPRTPGVVRRLLAGRKALFGEDCYHVDTSHLSSIVQMALQLGPGPDLELARELCEYGACLSGRFLAQHDPPFEEFYVAYGHYLGAIAGDKVDETVAYFRSQVEKADPQEVGTYPAEVLVNLLLRVGRDTEALAVAQKHLAAAEGRQLTCPSIPELCRQAHDYRPLAEAARVQGDAVHFLAGLLASQGK
jgi:hypothetical protein